MINRLELAIVRLNYRQVIAKTPLQEGYVILDPIIDYIACEQRKESSVQQRLIALVFVFLNAKVVLGDDREYSIINSTVAFLFQGKDFVWMGADLQLVESASQACTCFFRYPQQIYL